MKNVLLTILTAIVLAGAAILTIDATVFAEARALQATLAEMQQATYPEDHPYFWFCPEPGECATDGYVAWYSAHGGS